MPRLPRLHIDNCLYYVTLRSNPNESIFREEGDFKMYMEIVKKYKEKYGFKMFAFNLAPKQLSLLVELKEGSTISMVMHDLNSAYTKFNNRRYKRKGHLFRERFRSVVVEKESYLLNLIRYIHLRPAISKLSKEPMEFTFNSNILYLHDDKSYQITNQNLLNILDLTEEIKEVTECVKEAFPEKKDFAQFMTEATKEEIDELTEKLKSGGCLGSEQFVNMVKRQMKKRDAKTAMQYTLTRPTILFAITILLGGVVVGVIYFQKQLALKEKEITERLEKVYGEILKQRPPAQLPLVKLANTEWVIRLNLGGKADTSYPPFDRVVFKGSTVFSDYFISRGFNPSNYALQMQKDGTLRWETMQRNPSGEIIFWRGEQKDGVMTGTLSMRLRDGTQKSAVSFTSVGYNKLEEEK